MNEPLLTLRTRLLSAAAYAALGILSLQLATVQGAVSPLFPAAGLALALMLMSGNRLWSSVWLGSLTVEAYLAYLHGGLSAHDGLAALATASGAALQSWVGARLVQHWLPGGRQRLMTGGDALAFFAMGGPLACLISATVGVMSLYGAGKLPWADVPWSWLTWWCGDTFGVWLCAPVALAFLNRHDELWRGRFVVLGALVLVCVPFVLVGFVALSRVEREQQRYGIDHQARNLHHQIASRLTAYSEVLASLSRLIEVSPNMSAQQFEYFTQRTLMDNQDLLALSFNAYVQDANRAAFERTQRKSHALPSFEITQHDAQGRLVRAKARQQYVPVTHIAPLLTNRPALGYDVLSEPVRADAVERARQSGRLAVTGPITLVQGNKQGVGLLALHPTYELTPNPTEFVRPKKMTGFAVGVLKVAVMAERARAEVGDGLEQGMVFTLSDPAAEPHQRLLYRSESAKLPPQADLIWQTKVSVMDREWDLTVYPDPQWLLAHHNWKAWTVSAVGLLFTGLLQVMLLMSTGKTALVRSQVQEKTVEIRNKTEELHAQGQLMRNVLDNISDPVMLKDAQGKFTLVNQPLARLHNTTPEAMIGKNHSDCGVSDLLLESFRLCANAILSNGFTQVIYEDSRDLTSGEIRHYKSVRTPLKDHQGQAQILIVASDLTDVVRGHEQVIESERRLREVFNITREAVWDWHVPSGRVVHNGQWYGLLGFNADEIAGTLEAFTALIHPDDKPAVWQRVEAVLRGETDAYQSEHRMVGKDRTIWVHDRGGVVERDERGHPVRMVGSFIDITERTLAQQELQDHRVHLEDRVQQQTEALRHTLDELTVSEKKYRMLIETTGTGYLILDAQGCVLDANPEYVRLSGRSELKDILGQSVMLWTADHEKEKNQNAVAQCARDGFVRNLVIDYVDASGHITPVEINATVVTEGDSPCIVSLCRDISERQKAMEAAHAANRAKSEFLANMSHEIRTPMNGVVGMVDILQQTELSAEQRRMLDTISKSSLSLLAILNDILDYSKIEAGKLAIECIPTSLHEVVQGVVQLVTHSASAKSIAMSVWVSPAMPQWVFCDPARLRQILLNLVGNAIKFTHNRADRPGQVALHVEPFTLGHGQPGMHLRVIDNGIGISSEVAAGLFQPFTQADSSTSRQYGGTGLGLSICGQLVKLMGGQILVQSTLGKGSEFTVELPLQEAPPAVRSGGVVEPGSPPGTPALNSEQAAARGQLILLAEDDDTNRDVLHEQLRLLGYTAEVAADGAIALEKWRTGRFALLLTDCHMPHMDGFALTAAIRQSEAPGDHMPIIAVTANAMQGEALHCLNSGMDDYLSKPLRQCELGPVLAKWLPMGSSVQAAAKVTSPDAAKDEKEVKDQPPDVPVWNARTLSELVGNNPGLHSRLLHKFLKNAQAQVQALNEATQAGNLQRLAEVAHTLKSAARTVGAFALGDLCQQIEAAATAKDSAVSFALTIDLSGTFGQVDHLIETHLNSMLG